MCLNLNDVEKRTLAKGEHLGFEWQIVYNRYAARCGYVRVLPGHPWFEVSYNDIDANVHGGLTFASHGTPCPTHGAVDEWWVGFDCGHAWDRPDPALPGYREDRDFVYEHATVKTTEYVRAQCESLCEQAAEAQAAVTHA